MQYFYCFYVIILLHLFYKTDNQMVEIGKKIKEILQEKGISINRLAEQTDYTRQGLSVALKTGDFKISILQKIADVLDVDICEFFRESGKSKFEMEMEYFIKNFQPFYYEQNKTIFKWEKIPYVFKDQFLTKSLNNIYTDFVLAKPIEYLNKKYKRDIKLITVDRVTRGSKYYLFFVLDNHADGINVEKVSTFSSILKTLFPEINDHDIMNLSKLTDDHEKELILYLENSLFLKWYKKSFGVENSTIQRHLLNISRDFPIALNK